LNGGRKKVICFGLGPIGCLIAKLALMRKDRIEVVGAIDIDPNIVGKDLASVIGIDGSTGVIVKSDLRGVTHDADIVLHATGSFLNSTRSDLIEFCKYGLDVVSTTEELAFPWYRHADYAAEIDSLAKQNGVTILAVGVNPGFVLDFIPIALSGVCSSVKKVKGERVLDSLTRRLPFQRKTGLGLTADEFEKGVREGRLGHVGLEESIAMVVSALNCHIDKVEQSVSPKISQGMTLSGSHSTIEKGKVLGIIQTARGLLDQKEVISYRMEMYAGAENPHDSITIVGEPEITLYIPNGTPGDLATASLVVNSIERVVEACPGLVSTKDLRPASSVLIP
jgi:hypothetical protein